MPGTTRFVKGERCTIAPSSACHQKGIYRNNGKEKRSYYGIIGYILGLYGNSGKENGNYCNRWIKLRGACRFRGEAGGPLYGLRYVGIILRTRNQGSKNGLRTRILNAGILANCTQYVYIYTSPFNLKRAEPKTSRQNRLEKQVGPQKGEFCLDHPYIAVAHHQHHCPFCQNGYDKAPCAEGM